MDPRVAWLLGSDEPWTRYRTRIDLLDQPEDADDVRRARTDLLADPRVVALAERADTWEERVLKRHDDASHPIYAFSTLADFGLRADDPGMDRVVKAILAHRSDEGAFETQVLIPRAFGGDDRPHWTWIACDAPTLLYVLLAAGVRDDEQIRPAVDHLVGLAEANGWRCTCSPALGAFRGPGRRDDPCPMATAYALKALSLLPYSRDGAEASAGVEALLDLWEHRGQRKAYLFGIGSDFRKLKYPYVWYSLLHLLEVLSRFPVARGDPRFAEMLDVLTAQADERGRYTAGSMYRAWSGWSFADKKRPSPWLTFLALRIERRAAS
jgi:hypothetical protein